MKNSIFTLLIVLMILSIFLAGCSQQIPVYYGEDLSGDEVMEDHCGDGSCDVADAGLKNVDLFSTLDSSKYSGSEVEYMPNVSGYLATPTKDGSYPSVILIHEWWGLNDNIITMANLLAQEGYVVLAVDIYEGEYAETSEDAGRLAGAVRQNQTGAVKNMRAAVDYLRDLPESDGRVASMGWCFGGGESLQLALSGEEMDATVIYYGNLVNDTAQLSAIDWPVLGIFGETDTSIPVYSVQAFKSSLDKLGIENEVYIYPGVGHAFANQSGARYAPNETIDAWEKTIDFLNSNLKESE